MSDRISAGGGGIGRPLPIPLNTLFALHAQRHAAM